MGMTQTVPRKLTKAKARLINFSFNNGVFIISLADGATLKASGSCNITVNGKVPTQESDIDRFIEAFTASAACGSRTIEERVLATLSQAKSHLRQQRVINLSIV